MLERERGPLVLELEDGRRLELSDKHLTFKLTGAGEQRISVYRLRIVAGVPEHLAAGYVEPQPAEEAPQDERDETVVRDAAHSERSG